MLSAYIIRSHRVPITPLVSPAWHSEAGKYVTYVSMVQNIFEVGFPLVIQFHMSCPACTSMYVFLSGKVGFIHGSPLPRGVTMRY